MIEITREWLNANKTDKGGITAAQVSVLIKAGLLTHGEQLVKGWTQKLYGKQLTEEQADEYYNARLTYASHKHAAMSERQSNHNTGLTLIHQLQIAQHEITTKPYWLLVMADMMARPTEWRKALKINTGDEVA